MGECWYKETCPHCKTVNWFYMYRPYDPDISKTDPDIVYKCFNCLKNFVDEEMDFEFHGDYLLFEYADEWDACGRDKNKFIDNFNAQKGLEKPR